MKKLFYASILGMAVLTACGPSAEEKAAKEKVVQDSLAAVAKADSLKKVEAEQALADSLKKVAEEARLKAYQDSVTTATAAAEASKKGKKK